MDTNTKAKCKFCKKDILSSNLLTHESRCERSDHVEIDDESETIHKVQPNTFTVPNKQYKKDDLRPESLKIVVCTQCGDKVPEAELKIHKEKYCKDLLIPCEFCGTGFPMEAYQSHADMCSLNPDNLGTSNENIKIPCEICGKMILGNMFEGHVAECQAQWERNKKKTNDRVNYHDHLPVDEEEEENLFTHPSQQRQNLNQQNRSNQQQYQQRQQQQQQQRQQNQQQQGNFMNFPFGSNPNDFFQQMNMGTNPFGGNTMFSSMGPSNMGGLSNNNFGHSSQTITSSSPGGGIVITTISRGPNGTQRTQRIIGGNQQQQQQQLQGHEGLEGDDDFAQFMNGFPFMMPQMQMGQQQQQQGGNRRPVSILDLFSMSFNGTNINIEDLVNMLGPREQGLDKEMLNSFATVKFDKEKSKSLDPELKKCAICMEDFEDQEEIKFLLCTHRFHSQCIDPWLEKHTTCPVCKKDFSKLTEQDLQ